MTGVVVTAMTRLKTYTRAASTLLAAGGLAVLMAVLVPTGPAAAATVPIDLYAVAGSMVMPGGQSVTVWGYSLTNSVAIQPGGPVLDVRQGDTVRVTLHNQLGEPSSLLFQGQAIPPDQTGAAENGGTAIYQFVAGQPGTYLYEAGLVPNAEHQVAMGLYGALIVRPTTAGRAYDSATTAFDDEAVLLLSEIDPALNNLAVPANFDMRKYAPRYFLVNGHPYPDTAAISTSPGRKVLLRYVNAGIQYHSMGVLGAHQSVLALDGSPLTFAHHYVAETVGPGQTADAIVTAPAAVTAGTLTVYDASLSLHNTNTAGLGGMLNEITVAPGTGPAVGPVTSEVAFAATALTATVTTTAAGSTIQAAEYFVDSVSGSGTAMTGASGASATVTATAVPVPSGQHVVYVRAQDSLGTWGVFSSVLVNGGDTVGPVTRSPLLTPSLTMDPSAPIAVHATADDTSTGGSTIAAGEYFIDLSGGGQNSVADPGGLQLTDPTASFTSQPLGALLRNVTDGSSCTAASFTAQTAVCAAQLAGGADNTWAIGDAYELVADGLGTAMTANVSAPVVSIDATIPASVVDALAEGNHVVSLHGMDSAGNWGPLVALPLVIDETSPTTSGVSASPDPNNGTLPVNVGTPAVRVSAHVSDPASNGVQSGIAAAEGFICTTPAVDCAVGANGTGFVVAAVDGTYDTSSEDVYSDIPLATIAALSNGTHTIYVHAKDAAGNWGEASSTTILIDKTAPKVLSIARLDPNPTAAASAQFLVTFSEPVIGVSSTSFSLVNGTGTAGSSITSVAGSGATRTVTVSLGSGGGASVGLNLSSATGVKDIAGNALPAFGLPFVGEIYTQSSPSLYFSTAGNSTVTGVTGADDADIYLWSGTAFSRSIDASAAPYNLPSGANVDGFDRVDATHFYVSFSGNVGVPGLGNVADEDIVYFNNGVWSLFFDGSVRGVAATDLDAISIVGGQLYFSIDNTFVPPGAGPGGGDDADIYRWNGGSTYTRVIDASAVGWSTANVDGLVWVDSTHLYLSYSLDTTIPGFGAVQDEDVVYRNGSTWSVFFNGTARGLTSGNLDIDAFDLP